MLAAGVAVLSMCACTEANEFTPSTNNSTKKITEIKVSSNAPALATRTEFHTGDDDYGVVTWETNDKLYFFEQGTKNYQVFENGGDDPYDYTTDPEKFYDWNYFYADGAGLDVGKNYYAYYFPAEAKIGESSVDIDPTTEEHIKTYFKTNCREFSMDRKQGTEDAILKHFMRNYDLLMSNTSSISPKGITPNYVTAKDPMDAIYMEHAFALVTFDLTCTEYGNYTNYYELPTFYQIDLEALDGEGRGCFATEYEINENGILTFTKNSTEHISTSFDRNEYYTFNKKGDVLSFYFLVHPLSAVSKLIIHVDTEAMKESGVSESNRSVDKTVELTFDSAVEFLPGSCYHFGLNVDFGKWGVDKDEKKYAYNHDSYWTNQSNRISLASWPTGMQPYTVVNDPTSK